MIGPGEKADTLYSLQHLIFCPPCALLGPHLIVVVLDDSDCIGGFLTAVTLTMNLRDTRQHSLEDCYMPSSQDSPPPCIATPPYTPLLPTHPSSYMPLLPRCSSCLHTPPSTSPSSLDIPPPHVPFFPIRPSSLRAPPLHAPPP